MFKILYLTQFAQIGGGETALISLISKLDKRKFETYVILPQKGQFYNRLKKLKVKTYILKLSPYLIRTLFIPGFSPLALLKLLKLTKKINPDLIHVNHLTLSLYAGVVAKILKITTVGTAHGGWDSIYFYQDLIINLSIDKILANTPHTANFLLRRKIIKPNKVKVIPFGVDTNKFKPATRYQALATRKALELPPNGFIVTIVGRLDPQKDHLTFLQAAKLLADKIANVKFFIVGSTLGDFSGSPRSPREAGEAGQSNSYYKQINHFLSANPSLAKKVVFGGFIEDMPAAYWASDVVVSTSASAAESFGISLVEAASCAIPIVSTQTASQHLIIQNGQTGFLVPPKNPKALAAKVLQLAKNQAMRQKFGQRARIYVEKHFKLEKYVLEITKVYLQILTKKNK